MGPETENRKPTAVFMAFGTKGDIYPISAIAAAFASNQKQYRVVLVTHSAHQNLSSHLEERHVTFLGINSLPVLSVCDNYGWSGSQELAFSQQKMIATRDHRQECYSAVEGIFGHGPTMEGDFILINFFALEGWSLAELFHIRCVVAAPYVVPYSAPSSFESHFRREHPLLYKYLQEADSNQVSWKDVAHWMWPLYTENWGSWRSDDLYLSPCPFTDPVTGLPTWHDRPPSPLLLLLAIKCPCLWVLFSCKKCQEISELSYPGDLRTKDEVCSAHVKLQCFLINPASAPPVFIGLSSIGSMGFLRNPQTFLQVIQTVLEITNFRFILCTASYEPLDKAVQVMATESSRFDKRKYLEEGICLFDNRLFCFPNMIPYQWLFPRCAAAIHHGGSGSTAAALHAGIPQVLCPFILDQFYWAEKMYWIGVSPEPLNRSHLIPDKLDDASISMAAKVLSRAINDALSPNIKARALEIAERISLEDGVMEAVKILKQEMNCSC
ncbi:sterol 3-beta-glucosyltransferase UGT80A2 isoform X3 [Populus alba x Populus x berolinensis]|nr:sterol 3-beta-glucosyltransferase UGT80A2 isoform X3 [Populus alba x Populus x berolinensis]